MPRKRIHRITAMRLKRDTKFDKYFMQKKTMINSRAPLATRLFERQSVKMADTGRRSRPRPHESYRLSKTLVEL